MACVYMTCGKICSGKSTYARELRRRYHAAILSVDEITLALFGREPGEMLDEYVQRAETYLYGKSVELVETGVNVALDWGFWTKRERDEARAFYAAHGIPCFFHYLDIGDEEWRRRVQKRNADVLAGKTSAYYVDEGLARKAADLFEPPAVSEIDARVIPDEKNMIIRRFQEADAPAVSELIIHTLRVSNAKDYPPEMLEELALHMQPGDILSRAAWTHFYVAEEAEKMIGCGAIGPYWGREDESSLFTIFVLPGCQGRGVGRRIVETLEGDEYALRAKRIEIPASVTGLPFYRKLGYDFKNGCAELDEERLYRLEKYRD